jgi:Putative cyclase
VNWVVEQITATQQIGTHLDALNHLQVGDRSYNGHRLVDIAEDHGTNRLGVDTLPQIVTRGLLLDVAAVRGVERLEPGDVITVADAQAAPGDRSLRPGDAILFHTGWGRWWGVDDRYSADPADELRLHQDRVETTVGETTGGHLTGRSTADHDSVRDPSLRFGGQVFALGQARGGAVCGLGHGSPPRSRPVVPGALPALRVTRAALAGQQGHHHRRPGASP